MVSLNYQMIVKYPERFRWLSYPHFWRKFTKRKTENRREQTGYLSSEE
jgi:hypothetical protein